MNVQGQRLFDTRGFRIAAIAVAAAVVLGVAAYFFGTGLQADTSASVAPSPLGSSLTAVRESSSVDYVGRLINASEAAKAASLAALAESRSDFYADLSNSAAASRAASAAASRFADRLRSHELVVSGSQGSLNGGVGRSLGAVLCRPGQGDDGRRRTTSVGNFQQHGRVICGRAIPMDQAGGNQAV